MRVSLFMLAAATAATFRPSPSLPPLTRDTAVGVWEGIGTDDLRVFRLDLEDPEKRSFFSTSAGILRPSSLVFEIKLVEIREGRISLEGTGTDDMRIRIQGEGVGVRSGRGTSFDEGTIDATVMLLNNKSSVINSWKTRFLNVGGRYIETLHELNSAAKATIESAREHTRQHH